MVFALLPLPCCFEFLQWRNLAQVALLRSFSSFSTYCMTPERQCSPLGVFLFQAVTKNNMLFYLTNPYLYVIIKLLNAV